MGTPSSYQARSAVPLAQVADAVGGVVTQGRAVAVRGIRQDSRTIAPGEIFVARAGELADGLDYLDQATARGACAVLAARDHQPDSAPLPVLLVDDIRLAMATAAALIYGDPSRALPTVGVTGTNGKTTTCDLIRSVLQSAGHRPGVMGTLGARLGDQTIPTVHNTPEADELTRIAAWLGDQGASHLIMEVTSHALAQRRTDGLHYRVAAFTNLTQDHLDLHGTMEAYGEAKARLFLELGPEVSAVMVDDPFGLELAQRCPGSVLRVSARRDGRADLFPLSQPSVDSHGLGCHVATPEGELRLRSSLIGQHNLENLLLALAVLMALGIDGRQAVAALAESPPVPGRLERCDQPEDQLTVFVDYAHTPAALERVLSALRSMTRGRVICVFGCGGDRDRAKRPLMGEIVGRLADRAIVTNDNPRNESPEAIADAVWAGLAGQRADPVVALDRGQAIGLAVAEAEAGDVVLIAGKGHETLQTLGCHGTHFDDREQARQALAKRRLIGA
jgi:UDP-N-acetylmuramoyl-L-alanyl-D-glutamate--2,6-diaminopimelate ligase